MTGGRAPSLAMAEGNSVRTIQAGRIELFVDARFHGSQVFDEIVANSSHKLPPNTKVGCPCPLPRLTRVGGYRSACVCV